MKKIYRIEYRKSIKKHLKKIPPDAVAKIKQKINTLSEEPRNRPDVKKLISNSANEELYRLRVGDYRVIYEIKDDIIVVLVMKICHRKDVYRGL